MLNGDTLHLAYTCPFFTFTLYLCTHGAVVQTQPWASEKSGQLQESRVGNDFVFVVGICYLTSTRLGCLSSSPWPSGPSQPSRPTGIRLLWEAWSHCLGTLASSFISCSVYSVHHLIISSAALLLNCRSLCFVSLTRQKVL